MEKHKVSYCDESQNFRGNITLITVNFDYFETLKFLNLLKIFLFIFERSKLVGKRSVKSISSVCPSVAPSVRPSVRPSIRPSVTKFSQDWIISFSDIILDDSWPWYPVTNQDRFFQKILAARIWAKWAKIGSETRFFAIFSSLVYQFSLKLHTMIACNNA